MRRQASEVTVTDHRSAFVARYGALRRHALRLTRDLEAARRAIASFEGRKGRQLLANPNAALCFYWAPLDIQIRIEGTVGKVADKEADAYFATRERRSQIGAWASRQSEPLETPSSLDERVAKYEKEFDGKDVPRPGYWSGFRVRPERIEFWKGKPNRLHERHLYTRDGDRWRIETLYP